ncbi:acyltransferase family protein [Sinorhizobium alkalisoli]|uniref:acyltransferase family protein n=1 Tax=Sinorhizobium alkalisoli TaxID=1752398 RepID=UPI00124E0BF8|nr:acyltransferase family protein [Sinorhizobium alkalisoli]MCA1494986.1 acyltransferase [Ensifer sp. NBAIM29]
MRAVAILPVLLFHAGLPGTPGGFIGVDVFFVLSGYFMARIILSDLDRGCFSVKQFYVRRIRRILPALAAMIAVSSVAAWFLFMPQEFLYFAKSVGASALFISNILFRRESGYFDLASDMKPLLHTWSLSVEEQFYIIFPVTLLLSYKHARRWIPLILISAILLSFGVGLWAVLHAPAKAFYLLHFRIWELLIGALVAAAPPAKFATFTSRTLTVVGLACVLVPVCLYSPELPFPGAYAAVPCLGTALVIYSRCEGGLIAGFLSNPASVFIGRISYSLYLWHWPIIVFSRHAVGHSLTGGWILAVLVASFTVAYLSWRFVEQPARYGKIADSHIAVFAFSGCAILTAIAFAFVVNKFDGLPQRLPKDAWRLYQATHDRSQFYSKRCFADTNGSGLTPDQIRKGDLCRVGASSGEPQFLVWGDSHAAAIAPAIDAAARRTGVSGLFVGRASCPPLPNADFGPSAAVKRCVDHTSAVMSLIEQRQFAFVFMAAYWPKYVHRAELPGQGIYFDPHVEPSTADWSAPVRASLETTLAKLTHQGTRAILVMDVPEMGYDVPEALARASITGGSLDIAPSLAYTNKRQALARRVLQQTAKSVGALVIDPLGAICDAQRCHAIRDGVVLYADQDHLSAKGAESLAPLFYSVLSQTLSRETVFAPN